jgi:hypothetical protein
MMPAWIITAIAVIFFFAFIAAVGFALRGYGTKDASKSVTAIQFLGHMQRLTLRKGDVYVLTVDAILNGEAMSHLKSQWEAVFPEAKLVVLDRGMKLGVISSAALEREVRRG